ncbi:MAG: aminopeptidase P family protein [Bacteroidota bacterium]
MISTLYKALRFFRGAFLFIPFFGFAQELPVKIPIKSESQSLYDNDLLLKEFHAGRRHALRNLMGDSTAAVFFSSTLKNRSNDVNYEFHQDPNFYYLTGLREPDAMIVIFKNAIQFEGFSGNEILFLKDKDQKSERWTGKLLGIEGAKNTLGIQNSFSTESFLEFQLDFSIFKQVYYFEQKKENESDLQKQVEKKQVLNADSYSMKELMAKLREIKTKEELDLMRKAINITCDALKEAMKALEPGMNEFSMEAVIEYVFKSKGSEHEGYPSIIGGGENSCILHYETNRKKLVSKDMLVCDVGAEYHGYTADVTRTIPVSGKFSEAQKLIYNIVLEAQTAGIAKCNPGEDFRAPHKEATAIIQKRLLELGVIKAPNEVSKYFFHGTSHYLGLDVHDAGTFGKLKPNSVITVEPGIYIPFGSDCDEKWWGIGIRIEDDVLITETEPEVLSACVPKTIDEIEILMKQESLFNLFKK